MEKVSRRLAAVCVAFAASLTAGAGAGERAWYLGVEGGIESDGAFGNSVDSAFAGFVTLGRAIDERFALEVEAGYRSVEMTYSFGEVRQSSLMANAVYDLPLTDALSLTLGAGIGLDYIEFQNNSFLYLPFLSTDTAVAAQIKGGLSYALSDTLEVTADYRSMSTFEGDFVSLHNTTLTVGLRFAL